MTFIGHVIWTITQRYFMGDIKTSVTCPMYCMYIIKEIQLQFVWSLISGKTVPPCVWNRCRQGFVSVTPLQEIVFKIVIANDTLLNTFIRSATVLISLPFLMYFNSLCYIESINTLNYFMLRRRDLLAVSLEICCFYYFWMIWKILRYNKPIREIAYESIHLFILW